MMNEFNQRAREHGNWLVMETALLALDAAMKNSMRELERAAARAEKQRVETILNLVVAGGGQVIMRKVIDTVGVRPSAEWLAKHGFTLTERHERGLTRFYVGI